METDDIFASLGGSLMKDLMADLDDLDVSSSNLASLESQLDAAVGASEGEGEGEGTGSGQPPPTTLGGLPPPPGVGVGHDASASASAAALVLDHQQQRMAQMGHVPRHDKPPPPPPPGVGGLGGGQSQSGAEQRQQQQQQGGTGGAGADAWAVSLSQFENSLAAQDFLRADTESKKKLREGGGRVAAPVEEAADDDMLNLVGSLLEEEEEYDPDEEPVFAAAVAPSSAPSAEVRAGEGSKGGAAVAAATASEPSAPLPPPPRAAQDPPPRRRQHSGAPTPGPPPPHLMGHPPPPPPHVMGMGPPPGVVPGGAPPPPQPPMMMTPDGPVAMAMPPPPHVLAAMQQQQQQQQHLHHQHQQQQRHQHQQLRQQQKQHQQQRGSGDPLDEASRFRKGDFPTLGSSDEKGARKVSDGVVDTGGEREEEDADAPLIPPRNGGGGSARRRDAKGRSHQRHQNQQQQPTQILQPPRVALAQQPHAQPHQGGRVLFNDPRYSAQPVSAKSVSSAIMAPRDLTYVVGAMLRALQTADPHGDDYYFHALRERRDSQAPPGLFVYGQRGLADAAPEPASRETKERAREDELKYRNVVVSRAKDWKEEKQVLGHVVKSDVKRPRALLATTVLRLDPDGGAGDDPSSSPNEQGEDTTLRRDLWRARASVDRGYLALLELAELHRLLMLLHQQRQRQSSDPSQARPTQQPPSERQLELMEEVGENVARLHASLGIRTAAATDDADGDGAAPAGGRVTGVDLDVLASTLSLPKGREMLARSMERGLLPHASAEAVLPGTLACLFARPRPANVTESAAAKEDRLLRSLTSIVRLVHPALSPSTFLSCLEGVIEANRRQDGGRGDGLKKVLGVKGRAELMHAVLARGGEVCRAAAAQGEGDGKANGKDICAKWTAAEAEFLRILS